MSKPLSLSFTFSVAVAGMRSAEVAAALANFWGQVNVTPDGGQYYSGGKVYYFGANDGEQC